MNIIIGIAIFLRNFCEKCNQKIFKKYLTEFSIHDIMIEVAYRARVNQIMIS